MSEVQISKTLLILKSSSGSTTAAEQFLRNREWSVFATTNLKDFLTYIIQKKPSFVMISVDHPNKKVLMMPKVLAQSFPVCVFVFAENSSSISFRKLQDIQCTYKINPPATGPAIERTVNKYLRDQEKKLRDQANGKEERSSGSSLGGNPSDPNSKDTVIQSGISGDDMAGATQSSGGGWSQVASVFSQLLEGDDNKSDKAGMLSGDGGQSGDGTAGGSGIIMAKGEKSGNGSWVPSENSSGSGKVGSLSSNGGEAGGFIGGDGADGDDAPGSFMGGSSADPSQPGYSGQAGNLGKMNSARGGANGANGASGSFGGPDASKAGSAASSGQNPGGLGLGRVGQDIPGEFESTDPANHNAGKLNTGGSKKRDMGPGAASYNEDGFEGSGQLRKLSKDPNSLQVGKDKNGNKESAPAGAGENIQGGKLQQPKKYDKEGKIITVMGRNSSSPLESIILKGTKQALDETVEVHNGEVSQELEDSSQVACIVVESEKFNGYLIAAVGKNRKMDGKFIKTIQDKLFKFLKDNGETISDKDNMNLKIKKVEFEDWAVEYADFLKKSVHNGEEIAMAFFPVSNVRTEVGESASATMASVKLSEMEGDKQVEFNMYVYLPSNKKYVLYTPKGGKFYGNQKERLEQKGVKEVHMLKSEVNDLSKYKAQNYLNNLIDGFKKKKAGTPSAA